MRLFLGARGMAPEAFWGLTLPEIHAVLAHLAPAAGEPPPRAALEALMTAFPDPLSRSDPPPREELPHGR